MARALAAFGAAAFGVYSSVHIVEPGHRAVVVNKIPGMGGVQKTSRGEGILFAVPFFQGVHQIETRAKQSYIPTRTGSFDLQTVDVGLRLLYRPAFSTAHAIDKVSEIFERVGPEYAERVLPGITNEVMKGVVAKYDAEQLVTQRDEVSRQIKTELGQRAQRFNIVFDDVAIVHLKFSDQYGRAVEARQVAAVDAERAKYVVEKTVQETAVLVKKAEGESEAARIITDALQKHGDSLIQMHKIDTAKVMASELAKSRNATYLPSEGNVLLNLQ